ncbi:conserved Plasmodium protein, unknown function [Plasmodium vinckei vinckei]|uniref:Uncharacterized protein n=1 Tax=Plasmodium vinckei vinckei TaxID=54757 RepID=A0A449BRG2_PLAVN|nr:conserved Plasmodium protein, unknown function [Plasmodium vinckei vinckei]VEV55949.1 conserved Plasmodium protein, unknown function [Plasmodium vinckei vinckei]
MSTIRWMHREEKKPRKKIITLNEIKQRYLADCTSQKEKKKKKFITFYEKRGNKIVKIQNDIYENDENTYSDDKKNVMKKGNYNVETGNRGIKKNVMFLESHKKNNQDLIKNHFGNFHNNEKSVGIIKNDHLNINLDINIQWDKKEKDIFENKTNTNNYDIKIIKHDKNCNKKFQERRTPSDNVIWPDKKFYSKKNDHDKYYEEKDIKKYYEPNYKDKEVLTITKDEYNNYIKYNNNEAAKNNKKENYVKYMPYSNSYLCNTQNERIKKQLRFGNTHITEEDKNNIPDQRRYPNKNKTYVNYDSNMHKDIKYEPYKHENNLNSNNYIIQNEIRRNFHHSPEIYKKNIYTDKKKDKIKNAIISLNMLNNIFLKKMNKYFYIFVKQLLNRNINKPIYKKYVKLEGMRKMPPSNNRNCVLIKKNDNTKFETLKPQMFIESNQEFSTTILDQGFVEKREDLNDHKINNNYNNHIDQTYNPQSTYNVLQNEKRSSLIKNKNCKKCEDTSILKIKTLNSTIIDNFSEININDKSRKESNLKFFCVLLSLFLKKYTYRQLIIPFFLMGSIPPKQKEKRALRNFLNSRVYFLKLLDKILKNQEKKMVKIFFQKLIEKDKPIEKYSNTEINQTDQVKKNVDKQPNFDDHKKAEQLKNNPYSTDEIDGKYKKENQKKETKKDNNNNYSNSKEQKKETSPSACFGKPKIYRTDDYAIFYNKKLLNEKNKTYHECLLRSKSDTLLDFLKRSKMYKFTNSIMIESMTESMNSSGNKSSSGFEQFFTATYKLSTDNFARDKYKSKLNFSGYKNMLDYSTMFSSCTHKNKNDNSDKKIKNNHINMDSNFFYINNQKDGGNTKPYKIYREDNKIEKNNSISLTPIYDYEFHSNKKIEIIDEKHINKNLGKINENPYTLKNTNLNDKECREFFKNIKKKLKINYKEILHTNIKKIPDLHISDLSSTIDISKHDQQSYKPGKKIKKNKNTNSNTNNNNNNDNNNICNDSILNNLNFLTESDMALINNFSQNVTK